MTTRLLAAVALALAIATPPLAGQRANAANEAVDHIFAKWTTATPGCAVGISVDGQTALTKAYGMADLEHEVGNTPETIFEAGSVAKQFTAAAVLLLARDGKLSLDDAARKYIPELPEYNTPLTIRHMLNHTSGLRDWGSVAGIAGWPRTTRAYSHAHVLDIVSRQRALNFIPGSRWSYSNTGFNLAAVLVSRVSGMSFAEFSQQRIFGPLGMTRTSWRDDHRRIVKGRAVAYSEDGGAYRTLMPFESVHGNGGLLTTVGDLLTWNHNFSTPVVGDAAFVRDQEAAGTFNDGRAHGYALGLMVGKFKGVRTVEHSGSTAGYRAHLSRYPDEELSVAVLCNGSNGNATAYANAVADTYLGDRARPPVEAAAAHVLTPEERARVTGLYKSSLTGEAVNIVATDLGVRFERGTSFLPISATRFVSAGGDTWVVNGSTARLTDAYGSVESYEPTRAAVPTAAELQALAGVYSSAEAEITITVAVENSELVIKRRPDATIRLTPLYSDAFSGQIGTVIFRRAAKRVTGLSVVQDRVWDLRFVREADRARRQSSSLNRSPEIEAQAKR
ncbi:MAG: beta-lactamase family protein [Acidobacteria bacterium]|nr:beta-lactamase family protein [Acidobacteriota bacterium]